MKPKMPDLTILMAEKWTPKELSHVIKLAEPTLTLLRNSSLEELKTYLKMIFAVPWRASVTFQMCTCPPTEKLKERRVLPLLNSQILMQLIRLVFKRGL